MIAGTQVMSEFEEVTHFYLVRSDNYEVLSLDQKVMTLQVLLEAFGNVPKNDPEIMDITKNMELHNIAIKAKDEYFQLKPQMSELQHKTTITYLGISLTRMLKYNPVKYGNGKQYIPIDKDKGVEVMKNLVNIMQELGND